MITCITVWIPAWQHWPGSDREKERQGGMFREACPFHGWPAPDGKNVSQVW